MQPSPPTTAEPAETPEPYRYGYRYVEKPRPGGGTEWEQVPLTLEDVLHPQEDDVIPESPFHWADRSYLAQVFETRPLEPAVAWVTKDLLVDWGVPGLRPLAPDVGVFVGLREKPDRWRGTFLLRESGGRCLLVVEVVSPHTRKNDVEDKVELYHRARVPLYVLIDQQREGGPRLLVVYEWRPGGYAPLPLDGQGRFLLAPLGLYLLVREGRTVCLDAATGRELGDYSRLALELEEADRRNKEQEQVLEETVEELRESAQAREQAEKAARDAADRARKAEELAREEADRARKAEELATKSAEQAKEQADRAAKAEEQIRELQALLRQLQGGAPGST